ncbi:hypothetical protein J6590_097439 [Homalodisca vitripennis]|nr:hypothetical protein J6590_097439 [Homalodisca vitripennis]
MSRVCQCKSLGWNEHLSPPSLIPNRVEDLLALYTFFDPEAKHRWERHMTSSERRDCGDKGSWWGSLRGCSCQPRHKGVPHPICFDWRGWFRSGFSFFRVDMA